MDSLTSFSVLFPNTAYKPISSIIERNKLDSLKLLSGINVDISIGTLKIKVTKNEPL